MSPLTSIRSFRKPGTRAELAGAAVWVLPVVVIVLIYFSPRHIVSPETAVIGLLGLVVVAAAARWPDRSLIVLIVLLPIQGLLLAELWSLGAPTSLVRHLAGWKEALALGVVLAGARHFVSSGRRADAIDRLALGFVGIAALYVLVQHALIPGAPSSSSIRLLGFREDAAFVLLLLGARHAPLPQNFLSRAGRAALAMGVLVGGVAIFEALDSSAWNHFVVNTIQYTRYQVHVLNVRPPNPFDIRIYGTIAGGQIVRTGSVLLNAVNCGFYLVLGFAVGIERMVGRQARARVLVAVLITGGALLLTQTRSAILAGSIVLFLAIQPAAGRRQYWRTQLGILAVGLVLIGIPAAFASGLVARIGSTSTRTDQSTSGHIAGFWDGVDAIGSKPLGHGLGTSAGTGQRFQSQVSNVVIPENNYLQVGAELGVIPMLVFVALTVSLLAALRRCSRLRPDPVVAAIWAAGVGLAVGAWFLQTWSDFAVAWTFWGLAGAVLGLVGQANRAATAASLPTRNERPHLQSRSGDERARSGRQAAGAGV